MHAPLAACAFLPGDSCFHFIALYVHLTTTLSPSQSPLLSRLAFPPRPPHILTAFLEVYVQMADNSTLQPVPVLVRSATPGQVLAGNRRHQFASSSQYFVRHSHLDGLQQPLLPALVY